MNTAHNPLLDALNGLTPASPGEDRPTWTPQHRTTDGRLVLRCARMYDAPTMPEASVLTELFGARWVVVDVYAMPGCDDCDFGSEYGYDVTVDRPTKLVDEFCAWLQEAS